MTPFELHIENQAYELRFKRENIVNLQLLNYIGAFLGVDRVSYDDMLGYLQVKDLNFKSSSDFVKDGKFDKKAYDKYIEEVVEPTKRERGL